MKYTIRKVETGETVELGCGCEIEITKVDRGVPVRTQMLTWCDQHDPTLNEPNYTHPPLEVL